MLQRDAGAVEFGGLGRFFGAEERRGLADGGPERAIAPVVVRPDNKALAPIAAAMQLAEVVGVVYACDRGDVGRELVQHEPQDGLGGLIPEEGLAECDEGDVEPFNLGEHVFPPARDGTREFRRRRVSAVERAPITPPDFTLGCHDRFLGQRRLHRRGRRCYMTARMSLHQNSEGSSATSTSPASSPSSSSSGSSPTGTMIGKTIGLRSVMA